MKIDIVSGRTVARSEASVIVGEDAEAGGPDRPGEAVGLRQAEPVRDGDDADALTFRLAE